VPTVIVPVEDIVAVSATESQVVSVVDPNSQTVVELPDAGITVTFPKTSRATTYQVRVDGSLGNCGEDPDQGAIYLCATVELFDKDANPETGVSLIIPASLQLTLSPRQVEDMGGTATLFQAHALGALHVLRRDDGSAQWNELRYYTFQFEMDGSASIVIDSLRRLGDFALAVNEETLAQARAQVEGSTPTPIPTATPEPTATLEPTPTPEPTANA
jgi:hypothetical protein